VQIQVDDSRVERAEILSKIRTSMSNQIESERQQTKFSTKTQKALVVLPMNR
jgi:hypothetical protein